MSTHDSGGKKITVRQLFSVIRYPRSFRSGYRECRSAISWPSDQRMAMPPFICPLTSYLLGREFAFRVMHFQYRNEH